jgi:hypothetical protein
MQASKTTTEGSNAMALFEVLGIVGERLHGRELRVDFGLQGEDVFQRCPTMLPDVAKGEIADVHAVHHQRTRDADGMPPTVRIR